MISTFASGTASWILVRKSSRPSGVRRPNARVPRLDVLGVLRRLDGGKVLLNQALFIHRFIEVERFFHVLGIEEFRNDFAVLLHELVSERVVGPEADVRIFKVLAGLVRRRHAQLFECAQHVQKIVHRFRHRKPSFFEQVGPDKRRAARRVAQPCRHAVDFSFIAHFGPGFLRNRFHNIRRILLEQVVERHKHAGFNGSRHRFVRRAADVLHHVRNLPARKHDRHLGVEILERNHPDVYVDVRPLFKFFDPLVVVDILCAFCVTVSACCQGDRKFERLGLVGSVCRFGAAAFAASCDANRQKRRCQNQANPFLHWLFPFPLL